MKKIFQMLGYVVVAFILIKGCQRTMQVRSWPETPALISSHAVEDYMETETKKNSNGTVTHSSDTEYRLWVSYQFQIDGVQYTGRFDKDDLDDERQVEQQQRIYPIGKKITVRYDPQNPADSEYKGY